MEPLIWIIPTITAGIGFTVGLVMGMLVGSKHHLEIEEMKRKNRGR